jgi:hypothetical protein
VICSAFLFVRLSLSHILGCMLLKLSRVDSRFFFSIIQCIFSFFMGFFFNFLKQHELLSSCYYYYYYYYFIFATSTSFRRNYFFEVHLQHLNMVFLHFKKINPDCSFYASKKSTRLVAQHRQAIYSSTITFLKNFRCTH